MKRVLITGESGYIASALCRRMKEQQYETEQISLRGTQWKAADLSRFDVIVHTAGLAHIRETSGNAQQFFKVNRDLTVELAEKARAEGVSHFIFLSTAAVYGVDEGVITKETRPDPRSSYAKAKFAAECALREMNSTRFGVAILRPPMVYGDGCKGNYRALVKIARVMPCFASYQNQRSTIHIDRLTAFICRVVDEDMRGVYFPQDAQYASTCHVIREIAKCSGKKLWLTPLLNPVVWILKRFTSKGRKAFGTLIYQGEDARIEKF